MLQTIAVWCAAGRSARPAAGLGPARRVAGGAALAAAVGLGGCSLAFPLPGLFAEPETTQSVSASAVPPPAAGSHATALARALDPQGAGGRASWADETLRTSGHVEALGAAFVRGAEICRRFETVTNGRGDATSKAVRGVACRESGGAWRSRS